MVLDRNHLITVIDFSNIVSFTCLDTVISSKVSYPTGLCFLSELSNVIVTVALVTPA